MAGDKETDTNCNELFNLHCKREFSEIKQTLGSVKAVICGDALTGKIGMDERVRNLDNRMQRIEKPEDGGADYNGLSLAWLLKNWKAVAVIVVVGGSILNSFKVGKPMTVEEIKQVISQVQAADADTESQKEKK
jgi:hypothetical protein